MKKLNQIYQKKIYDLYHFKYPLIKFKDDKINDCDIQFIDEIQNIKIFKILSQNVNAFFQLKENFIYGQIYVLLSVNYIYFFNKTYGVFDKNLNKIDYQKIQVINFLKELK